MTIGEKIVTVARLGISFVVEFPVAETLADAAAAIGRRDEKWRSALAKVLEPYDADLVKVVSELNNHIRHRAVQGRKQAFRDACDAHEKGICDDGESCGLDATDCPAILEGIRIVQDFAKSHFPGGGRKKGPATQKQAQSAGMAMAEELPADLFDKVNRGEMTPGQAYLEAASRS